MHILNQRLKKLKKQQLFRQLISHNEIDLISNDYLGFAHDKKIHNRFMQRFKKIPLGATGSRLLGGNSALHEETEQLLAQFVNRSAAVIFPSGYQANISLLSALLTPDDLVFSDEYNHASIIDGIRLSKANKIIFPHRDYQFLENQLHYYSHHNCLKIIISESLFSMDGTLADIKQLTLLAQKFKLLLIIDEAHSTGLWGTSLVTTLGLSDQVFATIHTAGKALGASGAWIAGNHLLKKYLINFARPFIFSTAVMPAQLILMQEAIKRYYEIGKYRSQIIFNRAIKFNKWLKYIFKNHDISPIIPIILNDNLTVTKLSHYLHNKNWHVQLIRPPTVPPNKTRLRITIKWCNSLAQLYQLSSDILRGLEYIQQ